MTNAHSENISTHFEITHTSLSSGIGTQDQTLTFCKISIKRGLCIHNFIRLHKKNSLVAKKFVYKKCPFKLEAAFKNRYIPQLKYLITD